MIREIRTVIAGIWKHPLRLLGTKKMSVTLKLIQKQDIKVTSSILERDFVGQM